VVDNAGGEWESAAVTVCSPGREWILEVSVRRIASVGAGLLVICALSASAAASPDFVAQAKADAGPVATQADVAGSVASFLLVRLGNYAANKNAGNGFGQFLMQLGLGQADARELNAIEDTLKAVNVQLQALNDKVDGVQKAINNLVCKGAFDTSALVRSQIKAAWEEIGTTVTDARNALRIRSEKERTAKQELLGKELAANINKEFRSTSPRGAVIHIHDALVGEGGRSGMIDDCGFAYQEATGDFITPTIRERVEQLVAYWQGLEAQAAVMQIGLLVDSSQRAAAQAARERAENNLAAESAMIKPLPNDPNQMVADLRTHLLWWPRILTSRADKASDLAAKIPPLGRWTLPSKSELGELAKKCCSDSNAASWFRDKTPFSFDNFGLWTQLLSATKTSSKQFETLDLAAKSVAYSSVNPDANVYVLLVNRKSAALWSKYTYIVKT
jgi:hypothetical protein